AAEGRASAADRAPCGPRRKALPGASACRGRRTRKALADIKHIHPPAEPWKLGDDAAVIGVAARRRRKVAGHRERDHIPHNGASYQAPADGDSATVTRMTLSSPPSRPSFPARAVSASLSYTYLVKNSVVVLAPLNCGSSSRLR